MITVSQQQNSDFASTVSLNRPGSCPIPSVEISATTGISDVKTYSDEELLTATKGGLLSNH